jgi:hypothetical protein
MIKNWIDQRSQTFVFLGAILIAAITFTQKKSKGCVQSRSRTQPMQGNHSIICYAHNSAYVTIPPAYGSLFTPTKTNFYAVCVRFFENSCKWAKGFFLQKFELNQ